MFPISVKHPYFFHKIKVVVEPGNTKKEEDFHFVFSIACCIGPSIPSSGNEWCPRAEGSKPIQKLTAIQKLRFRNYDSETISTDSETIAIQKLTRFRNYDSETIAIQKLSRFRNYRDSETTAIQKLSRFRNYASETNAIQKLRFRNYHDSETTIQKL